MDRASMEVALAQKSIDLGIGLLSNIDRQERYGHRLLVRSRRRVWASATHPLAGQTTVSLKEIAQHPYIMLTVDDADTADRKSTRLNSSHYCAARMPSSA